MKFIFLTDTHIGGTDTSGYMQQSRYLSRLPELIDLLTEWIDEQSDIDFVIHGGDIIDSTTPENIITAADLFSQLPCPTYLTLGNHDLTNKDAVACWLKHAPQFFIDNKVDFFFIHNDLRFDIICCQWGETPYYWHPDVPQIPCFLPEQLKMLNSGDRGRYRILVTHSPPCGLPCAQSGLDHPLHHPLGTFSTEIKQLAENFQVTLVLGAHNHMNLNVKSGNTRYVTSSAFNEAPFEFKLFNFSNHNLSMETILLSDCVNFKYKYDFNKTFVQGRPCDRSFEDNI